MKNIQMMKSHPRNIEEIHQKGMPRGVTMRQITRKLIIMIRKVMGVDIILKGNTIEMMKGKVKM